MAIICYSESFWSCFTASLVVRAWYVTSGQIWHFFLSFHIALVKWGTNRWPQLLFMQGLLSDQESGIFWYCQSRSQCSVYLLSFGWQLPDVFPVVNFIEPLFTERHVIFIDKNIITLAQHAKTNSFIFFLRK